MTAPGAPPQTSYSYKLERVYTNLLSLVVVSPTSELSAGDPGVVFGWDWSIAAADLFDVALTVALEPTTERLERVAIRINGRFRIGDKPSKVQFKDYIRFNAPALLMPYARELLSTLTGRGFYGPYFLQPVN